MEPIKINHPKRFIRELKELPFLEIEKDNGIYNIRCKCDDWFAKFIKSNLISGFDTEENELKFFEKLNINYFTFKQLSEFIEVINKNAN